MAVESKGESKAEQYQAEPGIEAVCESVTGKLFVDGEKPNENEMKRWIMVQLDMGGKTNKGPCGHD